MLGGLQTYAGFAPSGSAENADPDSWTGLSDEEVAMRLMQEEERAQMQRMLAMAGMTTGGPEHLEDDVAGDASDDAEVRPPH